jgi:GT2 family glycosyltransferase
LIVDKFDVVSWVKDGAWVLPATLLNLETALPSEFVHRKIAVDDHSSDDSVKILKDFGWEVYSNPNSGISSGANYALSKVDCPFFMSFEQDLLLSEKWWPHVPALLDKSDVAVASGVRFSTKPRAVHDLEKYVYRKYLMEEKLAPYLSSRKASAFTLGKTLDNTIYTTDAIRAIGGFPKMSTSSGIDTILSYKLRSFGYEWLVDPYCHSVHVRHGLSQELRHQRWYAWAAVEARAIVEEFGLELPWENLNLGIKHSGSRLLMSPGVALFVALKMRNPMIAVVHPLLRLYNFMGYLDSLKA